MWRRRRKNQDLAREINAHLELEAEEQRESGLPMNAAREAAQRALGNTTLIEEAIRDGWTWTTLETLRQDLYYAYRQLRQNPGFTTIALMTLGLGIGANTAVFSIINTVLLAHPPYPHPEQLVTIRQNYPAMGDVRLATSPAEYLDYRDLNRTFVVMAAYETEDLDLTDTGEPEQIQATRATSNLFASLGVTARIGRTFTNAEDKPATGRVAVLSDAFWRRRFNGNPRALGSTIKLNEQLYTIVGVMPQGFEFPATNTGVLEPPALWVPMAYSSEEIQDRAASYDWSVVGRLKPGVSLIQAEDDIQRIARQFQHDLPQIYSPANPLQTGIEPLGADTAARARPALITLAGAVAFVLLIACANVASLLVARSQVRQREMAVRCALGASAGRLIRQTFTESLSLTLLGGAVGWVLAQLLTNLAGRAWPEDVIGLRGVQLDARVLLFTLVLCGLTGLLCGLAPAMGGARPDLGLALKQAGRHIGASHSRQRLRSTLVVAEGGSAVVLLIGAGLLLHSFFELLRVPPGFDRNGVLVVRAPFNRQRYSDSDKRRETERAIMNRLAGLPGVAAVGLSTHIPLADQRAIGFRVEGHGGPNGIHWAQNALVSGNYFAAMGIALKGGRTFDNQDTPDHPLAIVVNKTMAHDYWPAENALGKRVLWGGRQLTIVGVCDDVRLKAPDAAVDPTIYGNVFQVESGATASAVFIIRTKSSDMSSLAQSVRNAIWSVDRGLAVFGVRTMKEIVSRSLATRRFTMAMLCGFAFVALLLAVVGLYGILSYTVTQRTSELGVRLALGAHPKQVARLVVGNGMRLATVGLFTGLLAAMAVASAMSKLLFGIHPLDPETFSIAAVLLLIVSLMASYIPARRASRVDPIVALRYE